MNHIGNNSISSFFLFFFPNNQVFCLKFVLLVCVCYCYSFSTNQENIYFLRSIHNINVKVEKRMALRNTINKCKTMLTTIFYMSCREQSQNGDRLFCPYRKNTPPAFILTFNVTDNTLLWQALFLMRKLHSISTK